MVALTLLAGLAGGCGDDPSSGTPAFDGQCDPNVEAGAPSPVYAIKQGDISAGEQVQLSEVAVVARTREGFFVQVPPTSPACDPAQGTRYSGIFVENEPGRTLPSVDDVVAISDARVGRQDAQIRLEEVRWSPTGGSLRVPATIVEIDQVVQDGPLSPYEGVLVRVENVEVTEVRGGSAFVVDSALAVDDFAGHTIVPTPQVGDSYRALLGVTAWRNSAIELGPRTARDVTCGSGTCAQ